MILSVPITERIEQALDAKDWENLDEIVADASPLKSKHAYDFTKRNINSVIIDYAFRKNMPELFSAIHTIPEESAEDLFSLVIEHYIKTNDINWFNALLTLPKNLGKKSSQSKITSFIAKTLISNGISESDPKNIKLGLVVLNKIIFRKCRSDSILECIPKLTEWTILSGDIAIFYQIRDLISEINDVSKRAALHEEIAQVLATIAIQKRDMKLFLESIRFAATIRQKLRRKECFIHIINVGIKSIFEKNLLEIGTFIANFEYHSDVIQGELINILIEQLLDRVKNKDQINNNLDFLIHKLPFTNGLIIQNLLKKAEQSGDTWYLLNAINFLACLPSKEKYPVKDIVRTGIVTARSMQSTQILVNLISFVETSCTSKDAMGIYLQFSQTMLELGDFDNAAILFEKIAQPDDILPQYYNLLTKLLVEGVFHDKKSSQFEVILGKSDSPVYSRAISQAALQVCHLAPFADIVKHNYSLKQFLTLRSGNDTLILEGITSLTKRGFLDSCDSSLLVDLAKLIQDQSIREQAISTVVMKLAEIGVRAGNRDFLQQAVGITCLIEGQTTRSETLNQIIDDAAILAAAQGDLDLLLRMRIWSSSLLDPGVVTYAMTNIIKGMIKYATSKKFAGALDEAYQIAQGIEDPTLRMQLCEQIAESFVRIGCDLIQETSPPKSRSNKRIAIAPFEKGLKLLKSEVKKPERSRKIAGMIDIILFFSKKSSSNDYILPLALYSTEIEDPLERKAMMSRVVSNLNEDLIHPDSADPYEILAYILLHHYQTQSTPEIVDLIHNLLDMAQDPFVRLIGLCTLAESANRIHNGKRSRIILDEIYSAVPILTAEYQKALIMADLTIGYLHIDPEKAKICLNEGLDKLQRVESEKDAIVRRRILFSIISIDTLLPEKKRINLALDVIEKISDPGEYTKAFISAHSLFCGDTERCKTTIRHISELIEKIEPPYDQAFLILELVPLAAQTCEDDIVLILLEKAENLSKIINIRHIADSIRDEIARVLSDLSQKQKKLQYMKKSAEIITQIEDDELRLHRLAQIGYEDIPEKSLPYIKIMAFFKRIVDEEPQAGQILALERIVRSLTERGKRALLFCRLSILFRDKHNLKTSKRMLNNAIKESGIIRPLSKRAYVLSDMAMKMFAAGYENIAHEILDDAIDAATNIRQSKIRYDVFNELGLVIRILQGGKQE